MSITRQHKSLSSRRCSHHYYLHSPVRPTVIRCHPRTIPQKDLASPRTSKPRYRHCPHRTSGDQAIATSLCAQASMLPGKAGMCVAAWMLAALSVVPATKYDALAMRSDAALVEIAMTRQPRVDWVTDRHSRHVQRTRILLPYPWIQVPSRLRLSSPSTKVLHQLRKY